MNYMNYVLAALGIAFIILKFSRAHAVKKQIKSLLESKSKYLLLDVRTPAEYASVQVPGSVHIPLNELSSRLNELDGKENIIVYCQSGMRAGQAKRILQSNGHNGVINAGGWQTMAKLLG